MVVLTSLVTSVAVCSHWIHLVIIHAPFAAVSHNCHNYTVLLPQCIVKALHPMSEMLAAVSCEHHMQWHILL